MKIIKIESWVRRYYAGASDYYIQLNLSNGEVKKSSSLYSRRDEERIGEAYAVIERPFEPIDEAAIVWPDSPRKIIIHKMEDGRLWNGSVGLHSCNPEDYESSDLEFEIA